MSLNHTITICATARLSRGLNDAYQREQINKQRTQWLAPQIFTLNQWLDNMINQAMLSGGIDAFSLPKFVLSQLAEKLLWEEAISHVIHKKASSKATQAITSPNTTEHHIDLFDIKSLAETAIEANQLMTAWQLDENSLKNHAQSTFTTEETKQFLRWRHEFQRLCSLHQTLEPIRYLAMQINCLKKSHTSLPTAIRFVGFDRFSPLEQQLIDFLKGVAVTIDIWQPRVDEAYLTKIACIDSHAECTSAVAWAKAKLNANPNAQLAIISPVLGNLRRQLNDLLDDMFHPNTINASQYQTPRCYDFSIGLPLTQYPIINSALHILKCSLPHTTLSQPQSTALLQDVYFGQTTRVDELDNRALFDLNVRIKLGHTFNLSQLIQQSETELAKGLPILKLVEYLTKMQQLAALWPKKQRPSAWRNSFIQLLKAVDWSNSNTLSSYEYQAQQAWLKSLDEFAALDNLLGLIDAFAALQRLTQLTHGTMFQPEAIGDTHIQLLGLLETVAMPLDAIWVMGMNDHHWPPMAKANPLLPAQLQRHQGLPNASAQIQADFARLVHQRLCHSATEVVFSYALKEGDRALRASPTLENIPLNTATETLLACTLAETLAQSTAESLQYIDDHIAPSVSETETLRGGSQLLKTQAICPAWAFYQYRLGAKALQDPTDGLDSMARGTLVHAALQCFWLSCRSLSALKAMSASNLQAKISQAVTAGITQFCSVQGMTMPMQIATLEQHRLEQLLSIWLTLECERAQFKVKATEQEMLLNLAGITIKVVTDRIDELDDGSLVIIDYKTGSVVDTKSWADTRISDPQLPLYAAIAQHASPIAAVCFGKVTADNCQFIGVAAQDEILPNVKDLTKVRADSAFKQFNDWDSLILHWKTHLEIIAEEIKQGQAAIKFNNENALAYCEVKPLLRLPERLLQFERAQSQLLDESR